MLSRLRSRRRLPWVVAALACLVLGVVVAYLVLSSREGDISNPNVEFEAKPPPTQPSPPKHEGPRAFNWPVFGFDKARTHYLPLDKPLRPPFGERWTVHGSSLLEFTPALGKRSLYLMKNNGALYAVTRKTGKVQWKRKVGYLAASAPAYAHNTVYATILLRFKGARGGRVLAVSAKDGHTRWSRKLPSRTESSPLIDRGSLYFGSEDGTIYALRAKDGFIRWRYKASGAVKGAIALDDHDRLFAGDYSGHVQALRAGDGKLLWREGTSGTKFGLGSGNFYATPAVSFGRVYLGNTDGNVYSYAASDGSLAWRKRTNGYVYGSAAVAQTAGGRPTVYVGSYDGTLYALDARTGDVRWTHAAEGKISGGATVLGDLVFYSTLNHHTTALGANTGEKVWTTNRGAFNPVVSDGRGIFLNGYTNLFGIDGRPPHPSSERRRARVFHHGGIVVNCFRRHGHRVCHRHRLVCIRRKGVTICRVRRPRVCYHKPGRHGRVCHTKRRR
jgi:outer membrane protein assembly factor BamB